VEEEVGEEVEEKGQNPIVYSRIARMARRQHAATNQAKCECGLGSGDVEHDAGGDGERLRL